MSFIAEAFGGGKKPEIEPIPSRADAADALQAREEAERKRRALMAGSLSATNLTGTGGVTTELTGTRMLTNG